MALQYAISRLQQHLLSQERPHQVRHQNLDCKNVDQQTLPRLQRSSPTLVSQERLHIELHKQHSLFSTTVPHTTSLKLRAKSITELLAYEFRTHIHMRMVSQHSDNK